MAATAGPSKGEAATGAAGGAAGDPRSLGQHLARRLTQIGVSEFFGVPGDYNLTLLDELEKEEGLRGVWCCNELNAGYAADGFARVKGVGCLVVTFTVGGLSAINAVAGAYAENLPVICITGGPNTNDFASNRLIHHTLGKKFDFLQEVNCFKEVTCEQVVVHSLTDAHEEVDKALAAALKHSKPVYICIACNLAGMHHPSFDSSPIPYSITPQQSNPRSLEAAVEAAATFLDGKQKPVAVAGPLLRIGRARRQFMQFVEASGYPYAVMPAAKSLVPESSDQFMGSYWGQISDTCVSEVVESADAYLFAGPLFNDYASVGYTMGTSESKMVRVAPYRVTIAGGKNGQVYGCVRMDDFLSSLSRRIKSNRTALDIYRRLYVPPPEVPPSPEGSPLQTKVLFKHIQSLLEPTTLLLAETGDSIFNCQRLRLPDGCQYDWSQQYGSIGWSVGATLGMAVAAKSPSGAAKGKGHGGGSPFLGEGEEGEEGEEGGGSGSAGQHGGEERRVVACIGDGSFQVTAQDLSTMLRYGATPIIFLINNGGYTIEVEIHDGPYNVIRNWDYCGLVQAMHNGQGELFTTRVGTEGELVEAIKWARGPARRQLSFIECTIHRDDCSKELLEWGARVSAANSRPPKEA